MSSYAPQARRKSSSLAPERPLVGEGTSRLAKSRGSIWGLTAAMGDSGRRGSQLSGLGKFMSKLLLHNIQPDGG